MAASHEMISRIYSFYMLAQNDLEGPLLSIQTS